MNTLKDNDVSPRLNLEEGKMLAGGRNEFFRYIKKESVGETYKYLNQLIKGKSIDKLVDVNELVSGEEELPLFEESLRLIIIDGLHLDKKVVEILLNQNNYEVKRILKCDWFFQSSLSVESYCNLIIPSVSLSLRYKLLSKLSKTLTKESDAEKLFEFIHYNYSSMQAEVLLPKCSSKFILKYVTELRLCYEQFYKNPRLRILLNISKRHPEVGLHILSTVFNEAKLYTPLFEFKKILMFFASHHTNMFIPFYKKHLNLLSFLKFGNKMSRRYGLEVKEILFTSKSFMFLNNLKLKSVFKALSYDDKVRFMMSKVTFSGLELTINNWFNVPHTIEFYPSLMRPVDRLPFIETVFKRVSNLVREHTSRADRMKAKFYSSLETGAVKHKPGGDIINGMFHLDAFIISNFYFFQLYNMNFYDHPKFWMPEVLEKIPISQRLPYVEKYEKWIMSSEEYDDGHCSKQTKCESYAYLYNFDVAFVKLKEILLKTDDDRRRQCILTNLVKSCSINNDPKGLEELVEYVYERHRNDKTKVLAEFLKTVCCSFTPFEITSSTFEKIEKLAYYCAIRGHFSSFQEIIEKCIVHRLNRDLEVVKQVQRVFEVVFLTSPHPLEFLLDYKSKHSRQLFFKYYEFIINWMVANPEEEKSKEMLPLSILETLIKFNKWNKYDPIRMGDLKGFAPEVKKLIKRRTGETEIEDELINLLDKYLARVWEPEYKMKFFMHTLKRNPDWIRYKWNKVLEYLFSNFGDHQRKFFLSFLKFISFLGKTTEVKNAILKEFENGSSECYRRVNALNMYSRMANWEEFEKAIELYKPNSEKVDLNKDRNFINIQFAVPRVMRNVVPSWKCLPLMIKFFTGDYLKMVMPSFYPCCYSTRIDVAMRTLGAYLDDIEHDKRISIRKDVIRIIGEISNRRELLVLYSKWWDEINHYSIRSILLKFVSKCFVEVPTRETFKIVEKFIEESDDLVIQWKPDIGRVPDSFLNDYVLALWRFSERQKASFRKDFQNSILRYFDHDKIRFLSKEFCENIIENNLFESNSPLEVNDFTINYLISDSKELDKKVVSFLERLKSHVEKESGDEVSVFFSDFRIKFFKNPSTFINVFDALLKKWPDFPTGVLYFDRLTLNYCNIYFKVIEKYEELEDQDKAKDFISIEFGREVRKFYSTVKELKDVVLVVIESLKCFFHHLTRYVSNLSVVIAVKELVTDSLDKSLALIAIMVLPVSTYELYSDQSIVHSSTKEAVIELVEILRSYQDDIVNIYLRRRFDI